ncbi:MAG: CoA-binding protein [Bacillota bacterium]|nr:CoA-binding protein [Bacillota bacterium]
MTPDWEALLAPRSIAVVGASPQREKFSGRILLNLRLSGFSGTLWAVNPKYEEVDGVPSFPSVKDLPQPPDLLLVAIPAQGAVEAAEEGARLGARAAVILSGGFAETGPQGKALQERLLALTPAMTLYGPNCPGLWQVKKGLVYSFSEDFRPDMLRPGPIGLITQGGALGRTLLDAMEEGLGFSSWFSTGNEVHLEAADFLAFFSKDPDTQVVAMILEGLRDPEAFLSAAKEALSRGKELLALPVGVTAPGLKGVRRHTGKDRPRPEDLSFWLQEGGVKEVGDLEELLSSLRLFQAYPRRAQGGLAILSFSGGTGALLADAAFRAGVPLSRLAPSTQEALASFLPSFGSYQNPLDLTTAVLGDPQLLIRALQVVAADPEVGFILVPLPHRLDRVDAIISQEIMAAKPHLPKPLGVIAPSPSFPREKAFSLYDGKVPLFRHIPSAMKALSLWFQKEAPSSPHLLEVKSVEPR